MQKVILDLHESKESSAPSPQSLLERIAFALLLPIPLLLPIFFIPSISVPFQESKMVLLSALVLVAFALWIVARLKDGRFVIPRTSILLFGALAVLSAFLSALFSGALKMAFAGQSLELGTVASLSILFLIMFLVPQVFRSKDRIFYSYLLFFGAFVLIAVFQIARLFMGPAFLAFGVFTDVTANTLGKWNDLSVFFGLGAVLSLITLELISLGGLFRILASVALAISLFFLAIVNFPPVWYVLSLFSLIFFVYIVSFDKSAAGRAEEATAAPKNALRKLPLTSLVVLLVSLLFILGGGPSGPLSSVISQKLSITHIEARPSWAATYSVLKNVVADSPILGAGPNRFAEKWLLYKPDGINATPFWNTDFNFGVGFVPTFFVTTGLLGTALWIVFLALFLRAGFRAILSPQGDKVSRYLVSSSFLAALFLWLMEVFYTPSLPLAALTFFFTGLFIAALYESGAIRSKAVSFIDDPRKGFASVLILILFLIATIAVGYAFTEKFVAAIDFQRGTLIWSREGNLDKASGFVENAAELDGTSSYFRSLSQIDLLRIGNLFGQDTKSVSADTARTQFQTYLSAALDHARQAVALDQKDYQNWLALGQVYEAVVPLKIANAYESARNSYEQALALNPKSPAILLALGRLEAVHGNNAKAKEYIGRALTLKNNYTDAIFLLAQLQVNEGSLKDAIDSVQAAAMLSPNDSGTFFQLGFLRYNNKDYSGAVSAFEQAVALSPSYANAKYFLGLSYYRVGRKDDAIKQFQDLKVTNPDNKDVELILKNLLAGISPFTNAPDAAPEKRAKPPITEKSAAKKAPTDTPAETN